MPDNFEAARRQWEYSHAVNAVLTFAALCAVTLSAVGGKRNSRHSPPGRRACHRLFVVAMYSGSSCALRSNARKS